MDVNQAGRDYARETAGVDEVKAFEAGAKYALNQLDSEAMENIVMRWLHKNYLESYDKFTSSYHRVIARDLLKEIEAQ